jgi:hypothetical protein
MSISTVNPQVATLTRYRFVAVGSETSISGIDANGAILAYVAGKEQVYINGVLMVRGQDYTATNGTSITGLSALAVNDVVEVLTFSEFVIANAVDQTLVNAKGDIIVATADNVVTNVAVGANDTVLVADSAQTAGVKWAVPTDTTKIPNALVDAKGDLLTATADNTPARLAVGTDGQVLTAASGQTTGLQWATPASGGYTAISSGAIPTGSTSFTISSIPSTYVDLYLILTNPCAATTGQFIGVRPNNISAGSTYSHQTSSINSTTFNNVNGAGTMFDFAGQATIGRTDQAYHVTITWRFNNYANTATSKTAQGLYSSPSLGFYVSDGYIVQTAFQTTAISSLTVVTGANFTGGNYVLYGVK